MHELSVAGAVVDTAVRHAAGRPIELVSVRVGRLRQVVPDSLRFYFEIVARDTLCERARLELTEVELRLRCGECRGEWEPEEPLFRCPRCPSANVTVIAGEELEVDYIEVTEEEVACTAPG
jgi:hydrogenase nickel incorporation protein HypA/HybF